MHDQPRYQCMIRHVKSATPEELAAIATMLIEAGSPLDVLNGDGNSLRIYYGSIDTPEARAVSEVLRAHGARLHPDAK